MARRMVKIVLTLAEADALFGYAVEGQVDAEARGTRAEGGEHPATRAAGDRAVRKLGQMLANTRGSKEAPMA